MAFLCLFEIANFIVLYRIFLKVLKHFLSGTNNLDILSELGND